MTDWPDNLAEYEATFDDLEPTVEEKLAALDRLAEPPRGLLIESARRTGLDCER